MGVQVAGRAALLAAPAIAVEYLRAPQANGGGLSSAITLQRQPVLPVGGLGSDHELVGALTGAEARRTVPLERHTTLLADVGRSAVAPARLATPAGVRPVRVDEERCPAPLTDSRYRLAHTGSISHGIDPRYCDVIVTRWENLTGKKATLAA